ncbi:15301_t:CDS:2 [Gigaspora margarita]|uniref:15301_t:CDS:1 n=1 Tax=Gigaspora margarita TaxID=4874 RepID=A0ABN7VQB6_GIGMA|nr:15301_t:CDS:2 [Gigaspora margarita]
MIYMNTKHMEEKQGKKKINDLIKTAIPTKNDKSLKEIPVDFAVQQLNGLGLTVNYMYFVSENMFKQFLDEFMEMLIQLEFITRTS